MYIVRPDRKGVFAIIDAKNGNIVNRFNLPGDVVSGPIVTSDTCSVVTKQSTMQIGYIVKLPAGNIINRFSA